MSRHEFLDLIDPPELPSQFARSVLAIGNFDGVHLGHQSVLNLAKSIAAPQERPVFALSFEPHPRSFFLQGAGPYRLTPPPLKAERMAASGVQGLITLRFNAALAALTAEEFIDDILMKRLRASAIIVGADFRFGKGRAGTVDMLRKRGARAQMKAFLQSANASETVGAQETAAHFLNPALQAPMAGFQTITAPAFSLHGAVVSSSRIRSALAEGHIQEANALLGYEYFVRAPVIHGEKRGRLLGFPTANMRLDAACPLKHGIYAIRAMVDGKIRKGVASYGRRPTFDNGAPLLESFLFDFSGDLYEKSMDVALVTYLRGEEKFDSEATLIEQMQRDAAAAREVLAP